MVDPATDVLTELTPTLPCYPWLYRKEKHPLLFTIAQTGEWRKREATSNGPGKSSGRVDHLV